jgi:hypothetical protein
MKRSNLQQIVDSIPLQYLSTAIFHIGIWLSVFQLTNSAREKPWPNGEEEKQKRYCCIDAFRLRMMSIAKTINMATMFMAKNQ